MRPDMSRGSWIVVLDPVAGPGMDTSGAGTGSAAPPVQGVNWPDAFAYPSLPVVRSVPSTYRKTWSPRPVSLVTVNGRAVVSAWAGIASQAVVAAAATASAVRIFVCLRRIVGLPPEGGS